MGPELLTVPNILSAAATVGGLLLKNSAVNDAQQRSDAAMRQNMLRDQQYQDNAINLVNQNAEQYKPATREAAETKAVDTAANNFTTNLVADRAAEQPGAVAGRVAGDFTTGKAARTASELQRSTDLARLFAKVRGPSDMRANEAMTSADFASRGASNAANRGFMASAGNMDAQVAGRPDGTAMLVGDALQQGGTGMLAGSLARRARAGSPGSTSPVAGGINWDIV